MNPRRVELKEEFNNILAHKQQRHKINVKVANDKKRSFEEEIQWYEQQIVDRDRQLKGVLDELEVQMARK